MIRYPLHNNCIVVNSFNLKLTYNRYTKSQRNVRVYSEIVIWLIANGYTYA